jgi:O-antigen ligase
MRSLVVWWVALAVVLTGATQLRPEGLPIGPGEALLASWIFFMAVLLLGGRVLVGPVFRLLCLYWLAAAALLGFGALMAVAMDRVDTSHGGPMHDVVAYALAAAFTCTLSLRWQDNNEEYYHSIARVAFFAFAACVGVLLFVGMVVPAVGPVRFWYGGVRFAGWSDNPNQLAAFALIMPFFGWYLAERARGWRRAGYGLAIVCTVAIGLATQSDACRVAWLASVGMICLVAWFSRPVLRRGRLLPYVSYLIVPALLIASAVTYGPEVLAALQQAGLDLYAERGQGEKRFTTWGNGLRALAESPLVGWGPGAFSGYSGPFEGFEAHNNLIDWGASTGILGVALLVALWCWCAWRALSVGALPLFGLIVAVAIDGMFGSSLRQPAYWLVFAMVLVLTERREQYSALAAQLGGSANLARAAGPRANQGRERPIAFQ